MNYVLPFQLSICGKDELGKFEHTGLTHLLSLEDPGEDSPTPDWFDGEHQRIDLHDVENGWLGEQEGVVEPSLAIMTEIIAYGRALVASAQAELHVCIHCAQGRRRSTAAGYAILCDFTNPGSEKAALEYLLELRPSAWPNIWMVKLADEILEREGEMVMALLPLRNQPEA
jgi:predicted protein tyrosine phosphatase